MKIKEIKENKKQFLPLLLLADEQEDMIDRYLNRGIMYVLDDDGVKCECVVTDEGKGVLEIKNIATEPEYQGKGYGKVLIDFVATTYKGKYSILQVGTGDSSLTSPYDNGDYIYSENGCPMDFVSAMRFQDEMYEWWMSLSEEEREQELRELRGDYDIVSDSIIIDTEWSNPAMDPDAELPFS